MGWLARAGFGIAAALTAGLTAAQAAEVHLVYTGDVRGTVGICG